MLNNHRFIALTLRLCLSVMVLECSSADAVADRAPNIVFVLADDLGWRELGCYGNDFNETPHLDHLAEMGIRFTQAYAAAPVCSPYRASFLTGQHPARIGIVDYLRPNSANALSTVHVTLPKILKSHGYVTGIIGKWHLTGYTHDGAEHQVKPRDHGFDWNIGSEVKGVGNGANFWPYIFRDQPISWIDFADNRLGENEYLTDRLNVEAVDFIEQSARQGKPFFLYLSHYAPHTVLNGRPDLVEKYIRKHPPGKSTRDRCYLCEDAELGHGDPGHHWAADHNPHLAAMLESIDHGIGLITTKLDELGLAENTIFIFTSDNGGELNATSNDPLRGGKSELYEGGIRVPLIVRWPQAIRGGTVRKQPTQNIDFYPTLLEAAGIEPDSAQTLDGISTLASWKDPSTPIVRDFLAWHYALDEPHFLGGISAAAIRAGDWKLIERLDMDEVELYSLINDPSETTNLAEQRPEKVHELSQQLFDWSESIGARNPSPPLLTKARELYFAEHFNPNHLSERLWYNADWRAEQNILKRLPHGKGNTRIFLRDAEYHDCVIRFDFRLGDAKDVRLMTGSGGHYNTVLHVRPDHFFLQTAQDQSIPYFSFQYEECAYSFDPHRWYTITVEFLGDEAIAHLDHDHIVHAQHPIIDRKRDYFAIQVDEHAADFDNIEILTAVAKKNSDNNRAIIKSSIGKFSLKRSSDEEFNIRKSNAHEWYYQRDEKYRALIKRVDQLDELLKERFPAAFQSHKEHRKVIQKERKRLLEENTLYKETLFATYRANQEIDDWLVSQQPDLKSLPFSRKKAAIDRLRAEFIDAPEMLVLEKQASQAQVKLESAFPHLFITDQEITAKKKEAHGALRSDPEFQRLTKERATAYTAQQSYLLEIDDELQRLHLLLHSSL
ncbi:sulfatase-like hydrolase/transferase [Rubripirellula sp.]|nr:sulfatase-like hydrolase/transferase [Rubripirellula sp.]